MTPYCLVVSLDALGDISRSCSTKVVERANEWVSSRYMADRPALRGVVELGLITVAHLGEYPAVRVTYLDGSVGGIEGDLQEYATNLIKSTPVVDFLNYLAWHPA